MSNQARTTETLRLIRCGIADETYGLDMAWVRSVQRTDRLRRNLEAEAGGAEPGGWLPGSEGDVPVFNLAGQLGRRPTEGGALQRIIVLNAEPRPWALLVDRVSQVSQVPSDRVAPLPPIVVNPSANYFQGVIKLGEGLILLLSPERLHPQFPMSNLRPPTSNPQPPTSNPQPPTSNLQPPTSDLQPPTPTLQSRSGSRGQIIVFSIAEPHPGERPLAFGLSISQVAEVLEPPPLIPVPAAPTFVLGLVDWRDRPVPVIDLAARLGLASGATTLPADGRTRLMIARDKGRALPVPSVVEGSPSKGKANQGVLAGFLIRPAIQVLRLPVALQPCSRTLPLEKALTRGIVELENETLVIPDIRGIL